MWLQPSHNRSGAWLALAHVTDDAQGLAEAVAPGFGGTSAEVLAASLMLIGSEGRSQIGCITAGNDGATATT